MAFRKRRWFRGLSGTGFKLRSVPGTGRSAGSKKQVSEGETQYNIPVSSKQLIVYFVFLVIALTAAFLAGVMVGRNVDSAPEPTVRDIQDGLPEEPAVSPTPDNLTYGSALQTDKVEGLAGSVSASVTPTPSPRGSAAALPRPAVSPSPLSAPSPTRAASPRSTVSPTPKARPSAAPAAPTPKPKPTVAAKATPAPRGKSTPINRLTIQVGAFKDRAAADAIVRRLKGKGYPAYLVPVSEGLFNVRVGSFSDREDAERVLTKLESQEKFKPFIVKP